jgi:hypothetical protein
MATPHAVVTTETSKSLPLITWGGIKPVKKAKTINVKKGRKRGRGGLAGHRQRTRNPRHTDVTGWASFRRTPRIGPGLGFFRRPGPALCVWGLFCVFCEAV